MVNNCVVLREFVVPGGVYRPGMELGLNAVLLEDWVRRGFVRLIGEEAAAKKPKRKRGKGGKFVKAVTT